MEQELLREQCHAYVLGALDGEEREQLQRRIESGDPDCLDAIQEARELVAQLALAAPLIEPPPALRSRVLQTIQSSPGNVISIATRRRPSYTAWAAWAVAAAVLVFAVVVRRDAGEVREQLARLNEDYVQMQERLQTVTAEAVRHRKVLAVIGARDARTIRLATTAPDAPQFRAYWSQPAGLVLVGSNVPAPESGRTLQLWIVPKSGGGNPISAGGFQPDGRGEVVLIADASTAPDAAAALAISNEPSGGSPQPTTTPTWVGAHTE